MAKGQEAIDFHQSTARNQEFCLSTLHTIAKVQRSSQFKMITFLRRRRTLEGSLGRTGMETQTMVERPSVLFHREEVYEPMIWVSALS
jgi:hypothetical protein